MCYRLVKCVRDGATTVRKCACVICVIDRNFPDYRGHVTAASVELFFFFFLRLRYSRRNRHSSVTRNSSDGTDAQVTVRLFHVVSLFFCFFFVSHLSFTSRFVSASPLERGQRPTVDTDVPLVPSGMIFYFINVRSHSSVLRLAPARRRRRMARVILLLSSRRNSLVTNKNS